MRRLAIPSPCDAPWEEMTPAVEGRRCARCRTRVVDMTTMSGREATITASLFAPGSLCGRLALSAALATAGCSSARPIAEPLPVSETPSPKTNPNAKDVPDPDGDGVVGKSDRCPNDAEDKDGFEDDDGCPDLDNDLDRIPDRDDQCPNEPETYNGFEDEDGCPDKGKVIILPSHSERWRVIPFDEGVAAANERARSTLGRIASLLRSHPGLGVLHVRGEAERTAHVVALLAEQGVPRDRMRATLEVDVEVAGVTLELVED